MSLQLIRESALQIIANQSEGIRQKELFSLVASHLDMDESAPAIRNALWNLEVKYPELVRKVKISARNVELFPTEKLQNAFVFTYDEEDKSEEIAGYSKAQSDLRILTLAFKLNELLRYIDMSEIDSFLHIHNDDLEHMVLEEIEAILKIRESLRTLKEKSKILADIAEID